MISFNLIFQIACDYKEMVLLFLTIGRIENLQQENIYTDLMTKFRDGGHEVIIISPSERKFRIPTQVIEIDGIRILKVRTLNLQQTNLIEKGLGTLLIENQFLAAIKKYLSREDIDIVLYSTPPITFSRVVKYVKDRWHARSYLLLKDIFPQNAVDLNIFRNNSYLYRYFRTKEIKLYQVSDYIGCMSAANKDYLLKTVPGINSDKIEVNPNSITPRGNRIRIDEKIIIREKYGIPELACVFIYGGNLGIPQGISFLLDVISECSTVGNAYFLIVGDGTEFGRIEKWFFKNNPDNAKLIRKLPKKEFDNLVKASDVGMIFLDKRFSIPNYPSRLLSYLDFSLPVVCAIDQSTDIGIEAERNGYGFSCINGDIDSMKKYIALLAGDPMLIESMGSAGNIYLKKYFSVERSYSAIVSHL